MKILLIEDDDLVSRELKQVLTAREYTVDLAADGKAGWELIEAFSYDLILLDLILPHLDGISLCRKLRSQGIRTPIILITALDSSKKKVIGLDAGADDYITKPFDLQELLARIRALLRRGSSSLPPVLSWGQLDLNPGTMEVRHQGKLLRLTPKEYRILELFLRNPHRVFSRSLILDRIWSFEECPAEETVTAHIKGLRMKLKNARAGDPIETVYGVGYRLKRIEQSKPRLRVKQKKSKLVTAETEQQAVAVATSLWQHLWAEFNHRLTAIEKASDLSLKNSLDEKSKQEAIELAHKLVGSLGICNLFQASYLAREVEQIFDSNLALTGDRKQHLSNLLAAIRQELERAFTLKSNAKAIVLDRDPQVLRQISNLLEHWGIEVRALTDSWQFWPALSDLRPDLIILEAQMAGKSGIELCQILRQDLNQADLPILLLTESNDEQIREQIFAVGGNDYISKPIVEAELVRRILNCLEKVRLSKILAERESITGLF
ncbi:MAG: response regulator [Prochloraceae cyanobacterium]|nr:response regulator [Prochloraceae cyanobacterium]